MSPATAIHAPIHLPDPQQIAKRPSESEKTSIVATAPQSFTKGKKIPKGKIGFDTSGVSESITKILGSLNNTNSNLLPRSKKGINEKTLKKELSTNDEVVEDIIDLMSEMIIDKLIPAHLIKNTTQRDLYANKFSIVDPSNIVLGGTDKKVLTINVADEYDLEPIISLNLLEQFDYNTYKIDEVVVKLDISGKLKGKINHLIAKGNKEKIKERKIKETQKAQGKKSDRKGNEEKSNRTQKAQGKRLNRNNIVIQKFFDEISSDIDGDVDTKFKPVAELVLATTEDKTKELKNKIMYMSNRFLYTEDINKNFLKEMSSELFHLLILPCLNTYPGDSDRKELS